MAIELTTTPLAAKEDPRVYTPSNISMLFSRLLGRLAVAIEAEREIAKVLASHPTFDAALAHAENARDKVIDLQLTLRAARASRPEDEPLRMMASIIDHAMGAETTAEYHAAQHVARRMMPSLRCFGPSATALRVNQMLEQGRIYLAAIGNMEAYRPALDLNDLPYGLCEAWPEAC